MKILGHKHFRWRHSECKGLQAVYVWYIQGIARQPERLKYNQ